MPRLFITPREIDFIADITKELTKDVVGQKIYYYHVREDLSEVNPVYEEAPEKVFDPPIEIECLVNWQPGEFVTDRFGVYEKYKQEVYIQWRDLIDKDLTDVVQTGDYYSYGTNFFEITSVTFEKEVFGQIDHYVGVTMQGVQARQGQIRFKPLGPIGEEYSDEGAVQEVFVQQRGFEENRLGPTNDKRALQENDVLDAPITGPAEVSPEGTSTKAGSAFYDES
jgi:hypothetical protein